MVERLSDDTNATLLLCADLGGDSTLQPLTQQEYIQLAAWLARQGLRPASLMDDACLKDAAACGLAYNRLRQLMGRGIQLGFCVEEWQRSGVWIISRSDSSYPKRLRTALKHSAPPLLYGCGHLSLITEGGFAIVGPDALNVPGERIVRRSAAIAACSNVSVITAGHYRVAEAAALVASEAGGKSVRVLSDKLIRSSVAKSTRRAIADKRMALVSTCSPSAQSALLHSAEVGLTSIGLADQALYVSGAGIVVDTYGSATAMRQCSSTKSLFVWAGRNESQDARELMDEGASLWTEEHAKLTWRLSVNSSVASMSTSEPFSKLRSETIERTPEATDRHLGRQHPEPQSLYEVVLPILLRHCENPRTVGEISGLLDVQKGQVEKWLRKAVQEGKVIKCGPSRSPKYQANRQQSLLE